MKQIVTVVILLLCCSVSYASHEVDSLLRELDRTVRERQIYDRIKEQRIANTQEMLCKLRSPEQVYAVHVTLLDEYRSFNADSALYYVETTQKLAQKLQEKRYAEESNMNRIRVLTIYGMYTEALDLLELIDVRQLPEDLVAIYYHLNRNLYGLMTDHSVTVKEKNIYKRLTNLYRDSLLLVHPEGSFVYTLVKADKDNVEGRYVEAIAALQALLPTLVPESHDVALVAYTLADSYRYTGNRAEQKKHLITSSIADLKASNKEYIALGNLSLLLYDEGDIDRAYSYLKCAMEDATACNARLRTIEMARMFPIIDMAYQNKVQVQKRKTKLLLWGISIISIMLALTILFILFQMRRLAKTRAELSSANGQLRDMNASLNVLNHSLSASNSKLLETNLTLGESNLIKEEYLGRYMDNCSEYIDKMDKYRRSMHRLATAGKMETLFAMLKSNQFIEEEVQAFYANFDNTFLQLFPNFVEEFNALLMEEEQVHLKPGELLNTELRIFALIRLGISDSVKISQFLRYSVTTIYNYRTRTRNKAAGKRDEFEARVRKIATQPV